MMDMGKTYSPKIQKNINIKNFFKIKNDFYKKKLKLFKKRNRRAIKKRTQKKLKINYFIFFE